MVLQHVPQGARLVVVVGALIDAHLLGHGDLHVIDEVAVPQRLDEGIGKAEHQQVLHRFLAEVMIDAKHLAFVEIAVQQLVEHPGRFDVLTEGLLHHDAVQATGC